MDAQQFWAEFGHIANSPGGVGRLRELIIQLAISGRLVERIESESTASQVIEAAAKLRRAYEEELELRATRMHPLMDSRPFPVPDHWRWTRLEQLCLYIQRGKGPKYVDKSSTHVISQKCIQWVGFDLSSARFVADDLLDSYGKERFLCEGDLLWNSTGTGTAGRVAVYRADEGIKAVADSHVTVVRLANCSPRYLWCVIASPWVQSRIEPSHPDSLVSGTTQQVELNTSTVRALPIPLPPIEEQSRIVAKVDELMALCDKLEAQQQDRRKLQNNLRQSTLQALSRATSPHELQTTWARLAENLGRLLYVPEDVSEIKALILDLAIQGLLTDRQPDDQPAEALISRSLEAKRVRLASGEMKNKKPSATDIVDVEINIPAHWKRASLDELFQFIDYRGKTPVKTSSGVVLVTAKNVRPGFIAVEPIEYLSESSYQAWMTRGFPRIGDLLITTEAPLGNVARIEEQPSFALAQRVIDLQPFADLNTKCAMYFMMSPLFQSLLEENSTGMTAKGIKAGKLKQLLLPIPPKEEQQRIVQRVEELMNICSVLSSQLEAARKQSARLAAASVSSLTGIAIEQEEESMKAPQTELIALLRLGITPDIKAQAPLATILARHNGEMSAKDLWQRYGGEIDAFYAQLKAEVAHGWILEPAPAEMREKPADTVSA
ncbi:MAG: restriction endonuclease subunit S [Achromobacter mucicolens]|uniref:restriction endonuclease subunit S n=1 Tax=Achromobacter mucicolens TaxID=1389922 RepID=UPI003D09BC18